MTLTKQLLRAVAEHGYAPTARISGVSSDVIKGWEKRNPRLDLFLAVADAAGFEITMRKKSPKFRLMTRAERIEAFEDNRLIGYVSDETLFAIDKDGYAHEVGPISHRVEIQGKLDKWRKNGGASTKQAD